MDALLRELREGPDGIPEYHDTELSGDELTIGSGADQRIQLLGRAVAPEHAVIRKSGKQLELTCRRGQRVSVNGEPRSSAKLAVGDEIELAGHRLTIAEPPGGFDTAIELRPNLDIAASEFESAFRTDLYQTWLSKRSTAWLLTTLVVILGVVLPLAIISVHRTDTEVPAWVPGDEFWSSGPLSPPHQQAAGERCDTCHQELFARVQDTTCQNCHKTIHDHVSAEHLGLTQLGPTPRCATCHREHNEPASYMVNSSDSLCIDCHRNSETHFGQLDVAPVSGFSAGRHPEFQANLLKPVAAASGDEFVFEWKSERVAVDKAVEQSHLKFPHERHLDRDRVLTRDNARRPLVCADCHRLEPDGEHFEPIIMEVQCASCHKLTFDPDHEDRQLPHDKPEHVVRVLQDYFVRRFSDPAPVRKVRQPIRRIPGNEEQPICSAGEAPFDCAMRVAAGEIRNQFMRQGCVSCHVVLDTESEVIANRFKVRPIRLARDYFPAGRFDHRSHQIQGKLTNDAACLSCHKAKQSKDSAELMVPAMAKCEECHGDRPAVERVTVQCVSCHAYHPASLTSVIGGAPESASR